MTMTPGPWIYNGKHTIKGIAQVERADDARAIAMLPELIEAARDLAERCERARAILSERGEWSMLDTINLRRVLALLARIDDYEVSR